MSHCYVKGAHRLAWHAASFALGVAYGPALCGEPAPGGKWDELETAAPGASALRSGALVCPTCRALTQAPAAGLEACV